MRELAWSDLDHYAWLSVPVWACEATGGQVRWANTAAATLWGVERGALQGQGIEAGLSLEQGGLMALWLQAGQADVVTVLARLRQGEVDADVVLRATRLALPDSQPGLCLQADIPAPAVVDPLALRGVEAVLHFSLAVVMFDLEGRVLMQNPFALRAFPTLARLESGGFADLLDNKAEAEQVWRTAMEFGADQGERQFSARPKPRWYAYSLHRVIDPVTRNKAMLLTAQDITERVHSEQKFRVLFEQAANPLLLFDPAVGRVVDCNRAAAQALRLASRRQLIDTDPARFYPERQPDGSDSRQQAAALLDEAGRRGWQRFEWLFLRTDGTELLVEITLSPVSVGDRKLLLMAWYDLSFRRLIERQLRDAKDAAEAASRAKSLFLANMSHEIRTPLNAITGMAGLLLDGEMTSQQRQRLEVVHFSAAGLVDLVDDILDFSRIEAGRLAITLAACDLHALLHRSTELLRFSAEEKGLQLALEMGPTVPRHIMADEGRLRQILLNLAGNAIKFTPAGSVTLQVEWLQEEVGGRLCVVVADTGIGIEPDKLELIFEPFSQGDDSTSRRYGGSGLGLTITRRLVEAMHGHIGVLSQPGVGSRFRFEIPLAETAPPPFQTELVSAPARPLRILLAEDNPMNQTLALALLEQDGHLVTLARNGREAVACMERDAHDLILMDMQMPEMDGLSATLAIRALGLRGQLPIVAMTANVLPEDRARCLAAGMDDFLSKPIKVERLRQLLRGIAERLPAADVVMAADLPLFDVAQALAVCGGNTGLLAILLDQYLLEWPGRQAALQAAWSEQDMPALTELAHLLKGSLGAIGATQGVALSQEIERTAREGNLDGEAFESFLVLLRQCAEQFDAYRTACPGSAHATQ